MILGLYNDIKWVAFYMLNNNWTTWENVGSFIMCLFMHHMNTMQVSHPILAGNRIAQLINLFIGVH